MARSVKNRVPVIASDDENRDEESLEPLEQAQLEADEEMERDLLAGLRELAGAGEIRWQIYRVSGPVGKDLGYLATFNTSQLTTETIALQFGGGKYRIRGSYPNGTYAAHRTVDIAGDAPQRATPVAAAPANGVSDILTLMREERQQRLSDAAQRKEDIKFWATILAPIMTPVLGNLFGARKEGINELVTALASMKSLAGGEESKLDQALKLVEVIEKFKGDGGGGGETNWMDLVKEGLGMVKPAVAGLIEARLQNPPVSAAMPSAAPFGLPPPSTRMPTPAASDTAPAAVSAAAGSPSMGNDPMLLLLPWLKKTSVYLAHKAGKNADPEMYAEWLLDNLPDGAPVADLMGFLGRSDWWGHLSAFCPETRPYEGWFTALRQALIEMSESEAQGGANESPLAASGAASTDNEDGADE